MKCLNCGCCCRLLIIEIGCHDLIREPRLAATSRAFRGTVGPCGFEAGGDDDGEAIHDASCHMLLTPCAMLDDENRCTIYPTRPNVCVGFPVGGRQCLEFQNNRTARKQP
jgi:hypothetical protein